MTARAMSGKAALITGGGSGIGAAIAARLVADGARVCIAGRRAERLKAIVAGLPAGSAVAMPGDVALAEDAAAMAATAAQLAGGELAVVVNNAASPVNGTAEAVTKEEWQRALDVNLTGALLITQATLPFLHAAGKGAIINVASVAALAANPGITPYATSKAALVAFSRQCAAELGQSGIRVNVVCPGWIRTEMSEQQMDELARSRGDDREACFAAVTKHQPLARVGGVEEVAAAVAFLASDAAAFTTGAVLTVDGGSSIMSPLAEIFASQAAAS
jgi:meso-butanediol dehydrogenase/(S,S)-butanediol dehydrogenase/diacetyl reductase